MALYQGAAANTNLSAAKSRFSKLRSAKIAANRGVSGISSNSKTAAKSNLAAFIKAFAAHIHELAAAAEAYAAVTGTAMTIPVVFAAYTAVYAADTKIE